ncbi:MAG: hypothetical protein JM58_09535 [Peptococcaceae bacterium BICA1-8]|nr:MAG: hypothetical protein JM58_09535 [Peptococcaceae bacterium BICA1-8]
MILAIDPGNLESAYVAMDENLKPVEFGKIQNELLIHKISKQMQKDYKTHFALEMVASYGMAVGETVFETVFWSGRFWETAYQYGDNQTKIYRKDVKINLCHTMKAKDSNIRQALIDRFGEVGVKKSPGWFYGFKSDIWSAYAVGVAYYDLHIKGARV